MQYINQDAKKIVMEILTIVGYKEDKENYAKEFVEICEKRCVIASIEAFPQEKRDELNRKLFEVYGQEEKIKEVLSKYITPEVYQQKFQESIKQFLKEFIQELLPDMNKEQEKKLQNYLTTFQ